MTDAEMTLQRRYIRTAGLQDWQRKGDKGDWGGLGTRGLLTRIERTVVRTTGVGDKGHGP